MRSRVIPGSSPTIDRRLCVSRLKSVDLPTLGRPTIATSGSASEPAFLGTTDLRYVGKRNSCRSVQSSFSLSIALRPQASDTVSVENGILAQQAHAEFKRLRRK